MALTQMSGRCIGTDTNEREMQWHLHNLAECAMALTQMSGRCNDTDTSEQEMQWH